MKFTVKSDRAQTVDGIGAFLAGEVKELTQEAANAFARLRGVPLHTDNTPEGVDVTMHTGEEASA